MQNTEYPSKCNFDLVFGSGASVRVAPTLALSTSCQKESVHENLDANPYVLGIVHADLLGVHPRVSVKLRYCWFILSVDSVTTKHIELLLSVSKFIEPYSNLHKIFSSFLDGNLSPLHPPPHHAALHLRLVQMVSPNWRLPGCSGRGMSTKRSTSPFLSRSGEL